MITSLIICLSVKLFMSLFVKLNLIPLIYFDFRSSNSHIFWLEITYILNCGRIMIILPYLQYITNMLIYSE